ncbi:hypothetical protein GRJ2_001015800 [Grus japonensis]|uniref:Uncharacterized protein n=1 Tax=Grus japonensis TaxID=30415 RepID=A0ABC9WK06_GRUJA
MASNVSRSSWASLSTLWDGADMPYASSIQPDLEHPRTDLEEQPGLATYPSHGEEVDRCLEVNSVQQNQPDLEIQLGAPTPPPEVPEIHSREMLMPPHHHKGQETLEGLIPETKLLQELGRLASVDEAPQNVPASAPPSPRQQEERKVMVVPIVWGLPFLDEAVKKELEHHIVKMNIQRHYGLQTRILKCEQSFGTFIFRSKASEPLPPQRQPGLPFQHWDRHTQTGKSAGQPLGPQESPRSWQMHAC